MRLVVDSLIALMLVAILAVVVLHYRQEHRELEQIRDVHESLARLHEQVVYHRAMAQVEDAQMRHERSLDKTTGFPARIQPAWFEHDELPMNRLASVRRPWMDLAPPADAHDHPPDPVLRDNEQAGLWYNPQRGIVRARVPAQLNEQATLELYNRINGTALLALPEDDEPERQPRPHGFEIEPAPAPEGPSHTAGRWAHQIDELTQTLPHMLNPTPIEAGGFERDASDPEADADTAATEADAPEGDDARDNDASTRSHRPTLGDRPRATRDD